MNKEQYYKFEKFWNDETESKEKTAAKCAWFACLEANGIGEEPRIPEGYFKIGEEADIEARDPEGTIYRGTVGVKCFDRCKYYGVFTSAADCVRRIPAWKPKDGEAVLYCAGNDIAGIGTYIRGRVYHGSTNSFDVIRSGAQIKPFDGDESKIGKPWSEI